MSEDKLRPITIQISVSDYDWLRKTYGQDWKHRLQQHIRGEIAARKDRTGWYDEVARSTGKSTYKF